jgi:rhamnogalacturonyl hydrolase YesR
MGYQGIFAEAFSIDPRPPNLTFSLVSESDLLEKWPLIIRGYCRQVVTDAGRQGNYLESSATALFTYSLLKGLRLGFVDGGENYRQLFEVGRKAYDYMTNNFVVKNANGTLGWDKTVAVCSLNSTATYEVSKERM